MLPVIAGVARVVAGGVARAGLVAATRIAGGLAIAARGLGATVARMTRGIGAQTARTFARAKVKVEARKAIKKLDSIEPIVEEVMRDALVFMKQHTPKDKGNARRNTVLKGKKTLIADYPYAERLDNGWSKQAPNGFSKQTKKYIETEIKRRIKKELGK